MTEEQFKQKAEEYAGKYINHKMAVHDIFELEVVQKDVTRLLVDFAKEATKETQKENKRLNTVFADIIEAFTSCSYNDDFEMAQAGKEIYELFYGGKEPKEVFHNAEVPKCSRQLLEEAKEILREFVGWADWQSGGDCPSFKRIKVKAKEFLKEE